MDAGTDLFIHKLKNSSMTACNVSTNPRRVASRMRPTRIVSIMNWSAWRRSAPCAKQSSNAHIEANTLSSSRRGHTSRTASSKVDAADVGILRLLVKRKWRATSKSSVMKNISMATTRKRSIWTREATKKPWSDDRAAVLWWRQGCAWRTSIPLEAERASFEDKAVDDYCNAHEDEAPEQGRSTEGHLGRSKCAGLQSQCGSRTTNGQAMNRYAAQEIE